MTRTEAIENLAKIILRNLTIEERSNQLETMIDEVWDSEEEWKNLPHDVIQEFHGDKIIFPFDAERYDYPLLIWLKFELRAVSNQYLVKKLNIKNIMIGEPVTMESCPCCGRKTITERNEYEICRVCWWEDNGQDNRNSDIVSGPNGNISLTRARFNFIKTGIFDPERSDLQKSIEPKDKYPIGRQFIVDKQNLIWEIGTDWKKKVKN